MTVQSKLTNLLAGTGGVLCFVGLFLFGICILLSTSFASFTSNSPKRCSEDSDGVFVFGEGLAPANAECAFIRGSTRHIWSHGSWICRLWNRNADKKHKFVSPLKCSWRHCHSCTMRQQSWAYRTHRNMYVQKPVSLCMYRIFSSCIYLTVLRVT